MCSKRAKSTGLVSGGVQSPWANLDLPSKDPTLTLTGERVSVLNDIGENQPVRRAFNLVSSKRSQGNVSPTGSRPKCPPDEVAE